jgi:putative nucleotidyltransferase with HDIG domain
MQKSIKTGIIKKLILLGSVLSVVMGMVVGLLEFKHIDAEVKKLVFAEAENFYEPYYEYFLNENSDSNNEHFNYLKSIMDEKIDQQQFLLIELYYNDRKKLISVSADNIQDVVDELHLKHRVDATKSINYTRIIHHGIIYLNIIAPFFAVGKHNVIGYFEGIYKITEQQMNAIMARVLMAVVQVVAVIIAVTFLLYPIIIALNRDVIKSNRDLMTANIDMLRVLGEAIAKRDSDTNSHNFRVTIYATTLAREIGLDRKQSQALIKGAFLHDIGKIGIRDNILLKPGKLDDEEFRIMNQHVPYGVEIIKNSHWLNDARDVVEYHHEKYDGSGYLQGLSKESIPLVARIFAIVDVFDALTSRRPYKKAFSLKESLEIMQKGSAKHFDPLLFAAFKNIAKDLYSQYSGVEDEIFLRQRLNRLINRYF